MEHTSQENVEVKLSFVCHVAFDVAIEGYHLGSVTQAFLVVEKCLFIHLTDTIISK